MRLGAALEEILACTDFPPGTGAESGPITVSRINREIRRRRVVGPSRTATRPDAGDGRLIAEHEMDMSKLEEMDELSKKAEG